MKITADMARHFLSMRWWLAAAFAVVAAVTAFGVVLELNSRSEDAFRRNAQSFALGLTVQTAEALKHAHSLPALQRAADDAAARRRLSVFVFDKKDRLLTSPTSNGVEWKNVPLGTRAPSSVTNGSRYIHGASDGSAFLIGVRIHGGPGHILVTYVLRPELSTQLGIVRNELPAAAILAFIVGAAIGLSIAVLIGRRLRRLVGAANAIGKGDLSGAVVDRFPDEVGSLAQSIETMRRQLGHSFHSLRQDRERLEALLDRLNDGVFVVDRDLNVAFANNPAQELVGDSELTFVTDFARSLFDRTGDEMIRVTRPDGRVLLLSGINADDVNDDVIVVIHDESQGERQEKAQREFATNAAHELRTPLASIVTAIEMLQTGAKHDPAERDEFLELIEQESARLTRLTQALLVLARAEADQEQPRLTQFTVRPILERVAASMRAPDGVSVVVDCDSELEAEGRADLLEQAVASLATNAVQHTRDGSVTLRASSTGRDVVIAVADSGDGIPPERQGKIFERFYRADSDRGGFGLGLAIARDAVRVLGGSIDVSSTEGVGTTVSVRLPGVREGAPV
jgi:two-component system phosphate regulon sensor histidine kinase PhoR